jgi:hypothetical protein
LPSAVVEGGVGGGWNGGEYRKSLHFLAPGYGYLIQSPTNFKVTVMFINTNNPYKHTNGQAPLPRNSPAPRNNTRGYNGLLECLCTDRTVVKIPQLKYAFAYEVATAIDTNRQICRDSQRVQTTSDCAAAATNLMGSSWGETQVATTIYSSDQPIGCSVVPQDNGSVLVQFNKHAQPKVKPEEWAGATRFVGFGLTP